MTPREIIAKHLCTMAAHDWDKITPFQRAAFRTTANGFLDALTAAGFRIVGSDEVALVTDAMVERAFRDGVRYGTICEVTDIDDAWRTSSVRAALKAAMEAEDKACTSAK